MSTHDYVIDSQTAPNFRSDLNQALQALVSNNSSTSSPATTYANMIWYDTTNNLLRMRTEADDAWITLGTLDQSTNTFTVSGITNAAVIAGLGFTPVQQGGGVGQLDNKIFLGWDGGGLRLQVDNNSGFGRLALQSDIPAGYTDTQARNAQAGQTALTLGAYGTAVYLASNATLGPDSVVAGSQLAWSDASGQHRQGIGVGTWRCMGVAYTSGAGTQNPYYSPTTWLRIA
jgi:hypothetical protein